MKNSILLFYIPCKNKKEAIALSKKCIEAKLAACANIFPITSIFPWNKKIENASEFTILLKTIPKLEKQLSKYISKNHSYEIPCIATTKFKVNKEYFNWMNTILVDG
ncbi:MAG: divalent-cation tolerance protein CutA [Saprospiraceae bacterium]|nr:divalent-cation tolerance protein CutA [Saprospiraceae bacterium]